MERYDEAFAEIEAVCRKYNMAAGVMLCDGVDVRSCYGLDWATWSKVKIDGTKAKQSVGVPNVFKGRKDSEEFLQTANMIYSFGEAAYSISVTCADLNTGVAVAMKKAIDAEDKQNQARH